MIMKELGLMKRESIRIAVGIAVLAILLLVGSFAVIYVRRTPRRCVNEIE